MDDMAVIDALARSFCHVFPNFFSFLSHCAGCLDWINLTFPTTFPTTFLLQSEYSTQ